jgi:hypothetical protein
MGILPDEALRMSDKALHAKFKAFGSTAQLSTIKKYKSVIGQAVNTDKDRRQLLVKDIEAKLKRDGLKGKALKTATTRVKHNVNKIHAKNAKFRGIANDMVVEMGLDRDVALELADDLLKIPKVDVKELIADGKIDSKAMEIIERWSPGNEEAGDGEI